MRRLDVDRDDAGRDLQLGQLGGEGRGRVVLGLTKAEDFAGEVKRRSFVQMQYIGYLRRNANELPDVNFDGYEFWLSKLNQFNGDFIAAEMVKAFIESGEYRARFGP